jgi:hypothetical protein
VNVKREFIREQYMVFSFTRKVAPRFSVLELKGNALMFSLEDENNWLAAATVVSCHFKQNSLRWPQSREPELVNDGLSESLIHANRLHTRQQSPL